MEEKGRRFTPTHSEKVLGEPWVHHLPWRKLGPKILSVKNIRVQKKKKKSHGTWQNRQTAFLCLLTFLGERRPAQKLLVGGKINASFHEGDNRQNNLTILFYAKKTI